MAAMSIEIPDPFLRALEGGHLGSAVDADAPTPEARFGRGLVRIRAGRLEDARADLESARAVLGDRCAVELVLLDLLSGKVTSASLEAVEDVLSRAPETAEIRARAEHVRGLVLGHLRETGAAAESFLEAVRLYSRLEKPLDVAAVYDSLGALYLVQGQLESAASYLALSVAQKAMAGDRYGMAITLGNLGRLNLRAGRSMDALRCFDLDLQIAEELGDERGRARMLEDIGRAHIGLMDFDAALASLRKCLEVAQACGLADLLFFAHKDIALALVAKYREQKTPADLLDQAEKQLEGARQALTGRSAPYREHVLLAARAELMLARQGNDEQALGMLEEAARYFTRAELPDLEISARILLAEALAADARSRAAEHQLEIALARARRDGYARYLPVIREALEKLDACSLDADERGRLDIEQTVSTAPDGYTHLRRVGSGFFGEVYRALDPRTNRIVAIKRLRFHEYGDVETHERVLESLRVEMEIAAKIRYPGIARVLAIGKDARDEPYLVQEFIEGVSLRHVFPPVSRAGSVGCNQPAAAAAPGKLEVGGPPLEDVTRCLEEIALALDALHSSGIVHRDLKPENIILRGESRFPVLIDFGIARLMGRPDVFGKDSVVGTFLYMAPEQALGGAVDDRADIYSLGVIAHEWISGRLPIEFDAEDIDAFRRQLLESPPLPLQARDPSVPADLAALVSAMLAKRPQERPGAGSVARALRRIRSEWRDELADPAIWSSGEWTGLTSLGLPGSTIGATPPARRDSRGGGGS
ncbi:MAG: protein kinase [Planctomycetes bacterium]|nr:protein kinase [Planctomycetota bacterium]